MATLIDDVPYLLCNNRDRLFRIQAELLAGPISTWSTNKIHLNDDYSETYHGRIPCWYSGCIAYEIVGKGYDYEEVIGLSSGDHLFVQKVMANGLGPTAQLTIDKILFLSNRSESSIIVKCYPIEEKDRTLFNHQRHYVDVFGYHQYNAGGKRIPGPLAEKVVVPDSIRIFVAKLAYDFFPNPNSFPEINPEVEITSIRYIDYHGNKTLYYLALLSYGNKGKTGRLVLLDKDRQIRQQIDHRRYSKIIGLLDPGDRTPHLVALRFGSSFGGGVELLSFDRNTGLLQREISFCTVSD
jgi:hypothetical protein